MSRVVNSEKKQRHNLFPDLLFELVKLEFTLLSRVATSLIFSSDSRPVNISTALKLEIES